MNANTYLYTLVLTCCLLITSCNKKEAAPTTTTPEQELTTSLIEIIGAKGESLDTDALLVVCHNHGIKRSSVYQWENHCVIYDTLYLIEELILDLQTGLPGAEVKYYQDAYYKFTREGCEDTGTAVKWQHTLMTANLVADTLMQAEYMQYHATQFEEWPEVSFGFCKAGFQQLEMFRNGRQLMLIISIPEGESLDELDPKTVEDNPRVNDWNAIMAKYQEGIADAPEGAVWVLFQPI